MMMSLNMAYPCWDAPLPIILSKPLIEYQARTRRDISFCLCDKINFLESASAFNAARPPKVARSITKNSRAVAKQCAQAQILIEGTTPAFLTRRRVCCDQKLISHQFLRSAIDGAHNVALLRGSHGSNLTKNRVMTGARLSARIVTTWIP